MDNTRRVILATILSALVLIGFNYFFPLEQQSEQRLSLHKNVLNKTAHHAGQTVPSTVFSMVKKPDPRLVINAPSVQGTVNLRGAVLDDLVLKHYRETVQPKSPDVRILSPVNTARPNYVDFGWRASPGDQIRLPNEQTVWTASGKLLDVAHPLVLTWNNGQGVTFEISLAVDDNFMFTVTQKVHNATNQPLLLYPFYRVNRGYTPEETGSTLVHEGPIAVIDDRLNEGSYKDVRTEGVPPDGISWSKQGQGGWAGITDKYWLMAVVPNQSRSVMGSYSWDSLHGVYQVGFTDMTPMRVGVGQTQTTEFHVFAGAKEVSLLDNYERTLHIPMFWKAVDFGVLSFLTRPVFFILDWLNGKLGSFGMALLTFTVIVKVVFLPFTVKQMRMTWKMSTLRPQVDALRARYKDDPLLAQQQIMLLYRNENMSMFSGVIPLLIQVPVFWCLYKDLYITIEMRHAPFIGWIKDLSAPDPTNVFNLFGLLPFDPTHVFPFLVLGAWPIIYGITLLLMQKVSMITSDSNNMNSAQKKVMLIIPIVFTLFMVRQPVGLVIYYCWSNILTAVQQGIIIARLKALDGKARLVKKV
ncbi:MAG: membrane protein insertase YidC [Acetobacter sp.]|nr:membrane protein insertase YidC [Acetobacter sp.]MBQ5498088.1 membrane protein insertase YidC [Acetobacter sp.]